MWFCVVCVAVATLWRMEHMSFVEVAIGGSMMDHIVEILMGCTVDSSMGIVWVLALVGGSLVGRLWNVALMYALTLEYYG